MIVQGGPDPHAPPPLDPYMEQIRGKRGEIDAGNEEGSHRVLKKLRCQGALTGIRFAETDTVVMNIDHRPACLIHRNYPRVHVHESMENQQFDYDQSTFIGDNTVIGGLSQENEPSLTIAIANS